VQGVSGDLKMSNLRGEFDINNVSGKINGEKAQEGNYMYHVFFIDEIGIKRTRQGFVLLVR